MKEEKTIVLLGNLEVDDLQMRTCFSPQWVK